MKKTIIISALCTLLAGTSANAQVSVGIGIGEPAYPAPSYPAYPAYVEPGPGYVVAPDWPSEHYDIHRHRHNDYWAHRQAHAAPHEERMHGRR